MEYISGVSREQLILLPESVDEYVSADNTVRVIDAYVNGLKLAEMGFLKAEPHETGRPMYGPRDMLKLYLYGYMNRVRSSRRLEAETKRNLEVIWLTRRLSPAHKTIARFRHENGVALKNVFRDFVKLCMRLELYGKELAAIDGSKFKAVNGRERNYGEKKLWERIERIEEKVDKYLEELEELDEQEESVDREKTAGEIAKIIQELNARKERYGTYAGYQRSCGRCRL